MSVPGEYYYVCALSIVGSSTLFVLYCVHMYLTWEDVNISVLYHVVLESGITNTLWSLSDTL